MPHLVAVLSRKLGVGGDALVRRLRKRTPGLAQALLAVGPATIGWDAIPGTQGLKRFELGTPVRSAPEFANYLDLDVVGLFEAQRADFDALADPWPPVGIARGHRCSASARCWRSTASRCCSSRPARSASGYG